MGTAAAKGDSRTARDDLRGDGGIIHYCYTISVHNLTLPDEQE